jgi:AraC-like DNA-binding protein
MDEISKLMDRLAEGDGFHNTSLSSVRIFKASQNLPRQPLFYRQGAIIIGQGRKRAFLGSKVYEYNSDKYLVLSVPLPVECETEASEHTPLLAMVVDLDVGMLNHIFSQIDQYIDHARLDRKEKHHGLFLARTTPEIRNATLRLLKALQSPAEGKAIGPGIVQELVFRIMCGENASSLYALAMQNTKLAKVDKALKMIHGKYQDSLNVEKLAGIVNMSPSAFHRAFKEVTSSSPIQYVKKIRLNKARSLLIERGIRVNEAATKVGYESVTQFSREFKRYFGNSPVSFIPTRNNFLS